MDPIFYGIIVLVVAFLVAIPLAIILRKKNTPTDGELLLASRNRIQANAQTVEVLRALTSNEAELATLAALQDKLKYLTPSEKKEVCDIDDKILNCLQDMKVRLTKGDPLSGTEGVETLLAERGVYTNH